MSGGNSTDQWIKKWKGLDLRLAPGGGLAYREEARLRRIAKRHGLYLVKLRGGASQDVGGGYALVIRGTGMPLSKVLEIMETLDNGKPPASMQPS
jgi:hypothetical protein